MSSTVLSIDPDSLQLELISARATRRSNLDELRRLGAWTFVGPRSRKWPGVRCVASSHRLAGDQWQLGPTLRSAQACRSNHLGMTIGEIERRAGIDHRQCRPSIESVSVFELQI